MAPGTVGIKTWMTLSAGELGPTGGMQLGSGVGAAVRRWDEPVLLLDLLFHRTRNVQDS